ncbi:hypothetical protein [Streptomyces sp. NPDC008121]|uniref:hypothetical protein n=1 Tax=Streptomyces sp. NPDC008121 TaxID=3364809 RepID=UPI0036EE34E9
MYSSIAVNADHPASRTDEAMRVRASLLTTRFSTATAWCAQISFVGRILDHGYRGGADGSARDLLTRTSPIFGNDSSLPAVIVNRAFAVNRTACWLPLRDLKRGAPMRGLLPLRAVEEVRVGGIQVMERLFENDGGHLAEPGPFPGFLRLGDQ